ncbi:MAG: hypothetical protein LWW74_01205, partial [Burkholderiales bacterium]|nr:hypothetical protein [Burkholderiales bacterium]
MKREGNNLRIKIKDTKTDADENAAVVIKEDYYKEGEGDIIGIAEDGQYYSYVPEEVKSEYIASNLSDGTTSFQVLGETTSEVVFPWWLAPLPLLAFIGGGGENPPPAGEEPIPPTIIVNDVSVAEGNSAIFTITLSNASKVSVPVTLTLGNTSATTDVDATLGTDTATPIKVSYDGGATWIDVPATGIINVPAGVTSFMVGVPTVADEPGQIYEGPETFTLNALVNGTANSDLGTGTIYDDGTNGPNPPVTPPVTPPTPPVTPVDDRPSISVNNTTASEGDYEVFTVSLSNPSVQAVSVNLSTTAGTATATTDYTPTYEVSTDGGTTWTPATSATIAAGSTSVLVRVPTVQDTIDESDETFTLTATVTSGDTVNPSATGTATILDDDNAPTISINDVTVNESAGTATFTVTLSSMSASTVTVNYGTSNGTAVSGSDYTTASGTVTFAPGVTTQTITVPILDDSIYESTETFNVNLSAPVNATIADNLGVGTILDNEVMPTLAVSSVATTEGVDNYAVFTVSLSGASSTATTVNLALANGSATGGGVD